MQFAQGQSAAASKNSASQSAGCIELEKSKLSPYVKCDWEKAKRDHASFNSAALLEYLKSRKDRGLGAWRPAYEDVKDALSFYVEKMESSGIAFSGDAVLMAEVFVKKKRDCEMSCRMCIDFLSSLGMEKSGMSLIAYSLKGAGINVGHVILGAAGKYFDPNLKKLRVREPAEARKAAGIYLVYPLTGYGSADYQLVGGKLSMIAQDRLDGLDAHKNDAKYVADLQHLLNSTLGYTAEMLRGRQDDWMLSFSYASLQRMAMHLRGALGDNAGAQQHMTESFNAVQNALRTNPDLAVARLLRGELFQISRKYKEALDDDRFVYGLLSDKDPLKKELSETMRQIETLLSTPVKQK